MIDGVIPIIGANGHREEELSDQEEAEFQALKAERIAAIQVKIAAVQARRAAFNAAKEAREAAEEKCRSRVDKLPEIQALLAEYQRVDLQNRKDEEAEDTISKGGMKSFVDMDGRRLSSWKPGNLSKIHTTQIVVVRCLQHSRLTIGQSFSDENPFDAVKYRGEIYLISEREAFAPRRSPDFPSWSVLRGLARLRVVKDDVLFRAFMFGTLGDQRGMFFEHFSEHSFDASNLQDLISALGKFEVVTSCFWDSAWAHCFSEVIDLINDSMASELVCVPAEFVCYVVDDLLRCFYAVLLLVSSPVLQPMKRKVSLRHWRQSRRWCSCSG